MSVQQSKDSREEIARRGNEIYERQVRSQVEAGNHGKVVAIDINTGAYTLAENALTASKQLLAQHPQAEIWLIRIGHRGLYHIGHSSK